MASRFPQTWRVDPAAHYWQVRRRSGRARLPRSVSVVVAWRRRRRSRGQAVGAAGVAADGIVRSTGHVQA